VLAVHEIGMDVEPAGGWTTGETLVVGGVVSIVTVAVGVVIGGLKSKNTWADSLIAVPLDNEGSGEAVNDTNPSPLGGVESGGRLIAGNNHVMRPVVES
jgi:hypothetical protein